jgi:ribosomal protein S18 acetylase RimI-like enzyme
VSRRGRADQGRREPGNFDRRAHEHGPSVSLRVLKVNPAKALYDRLGFIVVGEDAATYEMRARP